jgi:hypothetical protein
MLHSSTAQPHIGTPVSRSHIANTRAMTTMSVHTQDRHQDRAARERQRGRCSR